MGVISSIKREISDNAKINYCNFKLPASLEHTKKSFNNFILKDFVAKYQIPDSKILKVLEYLTSNFDNRSYRITCISDKDFSNLRDFKCREFQKINNDKEEENLNNVKQFLLSYSKSTRTHVKPSFVEHRINVSPITENICDFYQLANTLTTGFGCGSWSSLNVIYNTEKGLRYLTPSECEAIQGWPKDITKCYSSNSKIIKLTDNARYKMIGNGLPSIVGKTFIEYITDRKKSVKYFSTFSGVGGMENTLNKEKFECVGLLENNKDCSKVLDTLYNIKNYGDITKLKCKTAPNHDLLIGGIVCKAWSMLGKSEGFKDDRGKLFYYLFDLLNAKKPKYFVIENVKGLVTKHRKAFMHILQMFSTIGYKVDFELVNCKDFGVLQNRERVIIVGRKK